MSEKPQNRLATEKSPYLLQHADNPVSWYPWGEEAFCKATEEDKPVFLSVGYATCHWCHVMAHESFEDREVAEMLNRAFVAIKVDREERPDIDNIYMTVCQLMTGSGGWPLSIIMTPDKRPFYAATYIPKESRFGRVGMLDLIPNIERVWQSQRAEVIKSALKVEQAVKSISVEAVGEEPDASTLKLAYEQLAAGFDWLNGGFDGQPKFPMPHHLCFLLRYYRRSNDPKALEMVERTLRAMRLGGIYDHVGYGFHRYSTDSSWLVPHFEKMLYNQALLAIAYLEAFQLTGNEEWAEVSGRILDYVLRDMTAPGGGFYSAEDADSEGKEGKFYLWTMGEIREVLSPEELELATTIFNLSEEGNYTDEITAAKTGRNILHMRQPTTDDGGKLDTIRKKLFNQRLKRVHPLKDDKILTDWNGLMVAAMAMAGRVLERPQYINAAREAVTFIFNHMVTHEGRLLHRYRATEADINAFIDDYAFVIWGLLELYEATFDAAYLKKALSLNDMTLKHFWDHKDGGFFFTADDAEPLLVRRKEGHDGAMPSGNSVAMLNLLRLGRITFEGKLEEKAAAIGWTFSAELAHSPIAYTQLLIGLDFALGPSFEVVVAGDSRSPATRDALAAILKPFQPNKVVVLRPTEVADAAITQISLVGEYKAADQPPSRLPLTELVF